MNQIQIRGKVIKGAGYGKMLGFPTANIDREEYAAREVSIPLGVYAGTATIHADGADKGLTANAASCTYKAGIVIGPLDEKRLPKIEAHLLDFSGDLYGKHLTLALVKFLRAFQPFETEDALKNQIALDLSEVRRVGVDYNPKN